MLIETASAEGYASAEEEGYLAALDTRLDERLLREGLARELVRSIQEARKQAGLNIADRITLGLSGSPGVEAALAAHRDYVLAETLTEVLEDPSPGNAYTAEHELAGEHWRIALARRG